MKTPPGSKRNFFLFMSFIFSTFINAQSPSEAVTIPDPNFEQALIDSGIDSDGIVNGQILRSDAESVTELNVTNPKFASDQRYANQEIVNVNEKIQDLTGLEAFVNITRLSCWANALTQVDVSQNTKLTRLELINNQLTSIDVSNNSDLEILWLETNNLSQIDVSNNLNLLNIALGYNNISAIDISKNTLLDVITIEGNDLSTIDVSNNPELKQIWVAENPNFSSVDFSNNSKLFGIGIYNTAINSLDLSNNPITKLFVGNNPDLLHLDLRNGNNSNMNYFWADNTPNLSCINADENISQAMIDSGKSFSTDCGDFVEIPDPNFEQALLDLGFDTDGVINQHILRSDAEAVTGRLELSGREINDLAGIEAFVNITELQAGENNLTSVDISKNTELVKLWFYYNDLTELDLSNNPKLERVSLGGNQLTSLRMDGLTKVHTLYVWQNQLQSIDLSNLSDLKYLDLSDNPLSNIDVSSNPSLDYFFLQNSPVTELDVSNNLLMSDLRISNTGISELDLSKNLALTTLFVSGTPISNLDVSLNPSFYQLVAENMNNLDHLDLRNGNNSNINLFRLANTPNLTCINADENISQAMLDSGKNFSTDCGDFVEIPDPNFEQALIDIGIDSDGVINKKILRSDAEAVTELNLNVESLASPHPYGAGTGNPLITNVTEPIKDLTGIEAFTKLTNLSCGYHALTGVDLSDNSDLTRLELANNLLTEVEVSNLVNLDFLNIIQNQIGSVDVSNNTELTVLWLESNALTTVDLSTNTKLINVAVGYNDLTELDVSANTELIVITAESTSLSTMDISKNLKLKSLYIFDNPNFTHVDLSNNPLLSSVGIYNTPIKVLDLSNNPITRLFIGNNPELEHLDLRNGNNQNLTQFWAGNTPNLSCINADAEISQAMLDSGKSFSTDCGDFVEIPDPNFEQALIDLGIDRDGVVNTSILREDAEVVTKLNLNNPRFDQPAFANPEIVNVEGKIADLTGIEAFVNLTSLEAAYGALTEVDLSANTQLEELFLNDNQLSGVDVSMLINLKRFGIMRNPLSSEIDLSGNPALEELFVHFTGISSIDLSANVNLWNLYIQNNALTSLDISANTALKRLSCQNNQLSELNISTLSAIERIDAQYNVNMTPTTGTAGNPTLTSLNLSGTGLSNFNGAPYPNLEWLLLNDNDLSNFNGNNNLNLQNLFLNNNSITKLNLSGNAQLAQLQVMNNGLEELDLRNGNNAILGTMKATGNVLSCMSVDDPTDGSLPYASWEVDMGVVFSSNCKQAAEVILIPDPNFEMALIDLGIDTNGENGALTGNILLSEAEAVSSLDVSGKAITDATGIEGFVNLADLNISNNSLTDINLIDNSSLINLDVSGNALIGLFVASGKNLISLQAENNDLQQLNLADLTSLEILDISGNAFSSINLSGMSNLTYIDVSGNDLTKLDLRNGNNPIIGFMDATSNPSLQCIGVDDASNIPSGWSIDTGASYTNSGDCEAPTVVTNDITVSLDRYGLASISPADIDNGSFDNVSQQRDLSYELDISDFDCGDLGQKEVTLWVADEFGNTASGTAIVTVVDEIVPSASSLRSIQLDLGGNASVVLDPLTVNDGSADNCSGNLQFSLDRSSFSFPGDYSVILTVTDASGNSASSVTDVEVIDSQSNPTSLKFKGNLVVTVYPNPFSDHFELAFSKPVDLNTVDAIVFTMNGGNTPISFHQEGDVLVSDNAGLLAGSNTEYALHITINGQTQSAIIIKE